MEEFRLGSQIKAASGKLTTYVFQSIILIISGDKDFNRIMRNFLGPH